jgi:hypothetical protein
MPLFLVLILAQLYAIYVSVVPLPISAATSQIWDMQRATNFKALLEVTLKDVPQVLNTERSSPEIKLASLRSTKVTKRKTTLCKLNAKHRPSITEMPMGGKQCAVR